MTMGIGTLANHYYSLGQDTHRTKQSSYAGLGSAGLAASRLAPVGLGNIGAGLHYKLPGFVGGAIAAKAGLLGPSMDYMGGGLAGALAGKLVQDHSTLRLANKLTPGEARRVLKEIPHYKKELVASSAYPLLRAVEGAAYGNFIPGTRAASNLLTDLLVRRRLVQQAARKR